MARPEHREASTRSPLGRLAAKGALLAAVLVLYAIARPAAIGDAGRMALAAPFGFEHLELTPADTGSGAAIRRVNPALRSIDAWISSVGAAVALGDLDGDARPNDVCLVDPRHDTVTLRRSPGIEAPFEPFTLPTPAAGYDARTIAPMGCLLGDMNEDGRTDALVYYWGRTPVAFLNQGGPLSAAAFVPAEIVPRRERWFTNAAVFADMDGDGHHDLVVGNYFRDGDRILDETATDGAEMQHSMSRAYNSGSKRLLIWAGASDRTVTFADASRTLPAAARHGWTLALGARDLDGDLRPELYIGNDFGPDRLLHNRSVPGRPSFAVVDGRRDLFTPRSKVLGQDSFKGMGVDFGDVDGNGLPDIAVSNIARRFALVESHFLFVHTGEAGAMAGGRAPYRDESAARGTWIGGWSWDVRFADLDNDGRAELLQANGFVQGEVNRWPELQELATGNDELLRKPWVWPRFTLGDDLSGQDGDRLLVSDANGRFHDIADLVGLRGPTVSRGIAVADVDGDGRLDVAIARQWRPSALLLNRGSRRNRALQLDLRLPAGAGTRAAIGAAAEVTLPDGRVLAGQVDGGTGHSGKRSPELHFGLGDAAADALMPVRVSWRDARGVHTRALTLSSGRHRLVLTPAR